MPIACTAVSVLIASPGDVQNERMLAKHAVENWNTRRTGVTKVMFLPLLWELHTIPEQGDRPQAIVNKQIVNQADALIAIFWTRLGTPTGVAESGTAEEIKELRAAGKHVAIYFSNRPIDPYKNDGKEFAKLKGFRDWCGQEGLIDQFTDDASFTEKITHLLDGLATRFQSTVVASPQSVVTPEAHLIEEYKRYMARASATWEVERDSETHRIDDAKRIVRGIGDNVLRVATSVTNSSTIDLEAAKRIARDARQLEQHQLYMDGGSSYSQFWKIGDDIVKRAIELV